MLEEAVALATVSSTLKMFDSMSGPLKSITTGMNLMLSTMNQMQNATNRNTNIDRQLVAAKNHIASAESAISRSIDQSTNSQNKFNQSMQRGSSSSGNLLSTIRNVAATYLTIQALKSGADISDNFINSYARLDMINDKLQTTAELQSMIFDAADRARGSYLSMSNAVGKMGLLASDAFKNTKELVRFTELMQKSFRVSSASTMEQQAGMYQLTQAMAAGKLQGDEFRSIMENAPMLAAAIAKFTGKSKGELKTMSAEGTITADIIKGALFSAADDINAKLATMPKTFGDVTAGFKNRALRAFDPVIQRINGFLNSTEGAEFIVRMESAIDKVATNANRLLTVASHVYDFFVNNWSVIEPLIWGIAAAIVYWTVVQWALNIALSANPIGLIIIAAAALIGIIIALVRYFINLWNTNDQFASGLLRTWNSVLNFFDQVPIFFQIVGNGIVDAFQWAKAKSLQLMEDMINGVVDRVNGLIEKLNNIKGVNIETLARVEFAATAALQAETIRQAGANKVKDMKAGAATKAAEREQKVLDFLDSRAAKRARDEAEKNAKKAPTDYDPLGKGMTIPNIGRVGEVGKINDTVDISSEDLKLMREVAEMKSIQNFVQLTPTVQVTGDNHFSNGMDIETVVEHITVAMEEHNAAAAQGVYNV